MQSRENNQITWDYTQLQQYFTDAIAANPATGLSDLLGKGNVIKLKDKDKFKYRNTNHRNSKNENIRRIAA